MFSKETQTEVTTNSKCDYEGPSERDLGWHSGRFHGWPSDRNAENMDISNDSQGVRHCDEYNGSKPMTCNFCEYRFLDKSELMIHKKFKHAEKVNVCWDFSTGKCSRGEESCWFLHLEKTGTEDNFKCNFCDKNYKTLAQLLNHKKMLHEQVVPACRNYSNGKCIYTNDKCWFKHGDQHTNENDDKAKENIENEEIGNKNENVDKEVIQKLLKMMEKFTHQITEMKDKNNLL